MGPLPTLCPYSTISPGFLPNLAQQAGRVGQVGACVCVNVQGAWPIGCAFECHCKGRGGVPHSRWARRQQPGAQCAAATPALQHAQRSRQSAAGNTHCSSRQVYTAVMSDRVAEAEGVPLLRPYLHRGQACARCGWGSKAGCADTARIVESQAPHNIMPCSPRPRQPSKGSHASRGDSVSTPMYPIYRCDQS